MKKTSEEKRAAFSEKMVDIFNYGALNLAMGLGYGLGLFDALDSMAGPQTAEYIAEKAGLDERYVREWLAVMVSGGIVELVDDDKETFLLPEEHGDVLAKRAGSANLGVYTQELPLLAHCVYNHVEQGFVSGKGVSYEHYPRFQTFMGQLADAKHEKMLVNVFLPSVENGAIVKRLQQGIRACDVGCGQGLAVLLMARAFPKSSFVGVDISQEALAKARHAAREQGLHNVQFLEQDLASDTPGFMGEEKYDYVTAFDAIHDQSRPFRALENVKGMLATNGVFSLVDIKARTKLKDNLGHPMAPFLYAVSLMHCMPVGLVDGGQGLGMMWGREKALEMLADAGFSSVNVVDIPEDPFNLHYCCRVD